MEGCQNRLTTITPVVVVATVVELSFSLMKANAAAPYSAP